MSDNYYIHEFNHIFPKYIVDEFKFPLKDYQLYLEGLSLNPFFFYKKWSDINRQKLTNKYWNNNPNLDWKWSLSFPLFSILEKYIENFEHPKIIGFSGLPGSGKSTLGVWINNLAT